MNKCIRISDLPLLHKKKSFLRESAERAGSHLKSHVEVKYFHYSNIRSMWCVCVCVCERVSAHVLVHTCSRSNLGNSLYHMENKVAKNISMTMQKIHK
jgi:predicted lipase